MTEDDDSVDPVPVLVSLAFRDIPAPDFADVVVVAIPDAAEPVPKSPKWWAAEVFSIRSMPWWVRGLFAVRQTVVGLIGISRGEKSDFTVAAVHGEEALIAVDERHLDFRAAIGVDSGRRLLRVTTAVRLHGWRGRTYFLPVSLLHGPVTRAMAKSAVRRYAAGAPPRSR